MNKMLADFIRTKSTNPFKSIEITTNIGCARRCTYCPQDVLVQTYKSYDDAEHQLNPASFERMVSNFPENLLIYWTGYSEPLQNKYFPELFDIISKAGHESHISTTLFSVNQQSIEVICDRKRWARVSLHLPDESGHMRAKIDDAYLSNLKEVVKTMIPEVDLIHVFGTLNEKIKNLFLTPEMQPFASKFNIHEFPLDSTYATSRANNLKTNQTRSTPIAQDGVYLYCNAGRFNQPVLLPNGDLSLCCMDYGLTKIIGNILHEPYDSIITRSSIYNSYNIPKLCYQCEWASYFKIN